MVITWTVKCALCGQRGSTTSTTNDIEQPRHNPKMSGRCPKNPTGGNFGHSPIWVRR